MERLLVGENINVDTRPLARETGDGARSPPVVRAVLCAVHDVAVVVAGAVGAAVAEQLRGGVVGAELLRGGPEVVDGVLLVGEDDAVWDEDSVDADALAGVGEGEGVVEGGAGVWVGEAVEVPVGVGGQHDGGLLGGGEGDDLDVPGVGAQGVGHVGDNLAGKAFFAIRVGDGERYGRGSVGCDGEVAVVPPVGSSVQSIVVVVLIRLNVILCPVNHEAAVLDAVRISACQTISSLTQVYRSICGRVMIHTWNASEMRMERVFLIVGCIVPAEHDVALDAILIVDEEVRYRSAIRNEECANPFSRDRVLSIGVRAEGAV